jgi:LacI family transcriptional regulator, repressor for deo operon, udp, cdd, tsx, nupC, and nupG
MPIGTYVMATNENQRNEVINQLIAGLQQTRLNQGLSLNQVAKLSGLDQTMVGRVEKRSRQPTIDTLLKLSDAVGADFPALLSAAIAHARPAESPIQRISSPHLPPTTPTQTTRPGPVTMTELATKLGLSRLTVSAVLNNRHEALRISDKTVHRVRETASQLGYVRNQLAIATKTGRTSSIGIIVSHFSAEWVGRILRGFLREARARNHMVVIEEVSGQESEQRALTKFMEQRLGGIFCCNLNPDGTFPEILAETSLRYSCPIVSSISHHGLPGLHVDSDDRTGMTQATEHLWALGHRNIACLGIDSDPQRTDYIVQAVQNLGGTIPEHWRLVRTIDNNQLESDASQLLSASGRLPTAIICATDELAAIAMRAANQAGLKIPADLSIVGFSNERSGPLLQSKLTTVAQPFEEMGKRAAERLLGEMQGDTSDPTVHAVRHELLPVTLIVRDSTGKAPHPARK